MGYKERFKELQAEASKRLSALRKNAGNRVEATEAALIGGAIGGAVVVGLARGQGIEDVAGVPIGLAVGAGAYLVGRGQPGVKGAAMRGAGVGAACGALSEMAEDISADFALGGE